MYRRDPTYSAGPVGHRSGGVVTEVVTRRLLVAAGVPILAMSGWAVVTWGWLLVATVPSSARHLFFTTSGA
jgi:hypothetical protein